MPNLIGRRRLLLAAPGWLASCAIATSLMGALPGEAIAQGNRGGTVIEVTKFNAIKGRFVAAKPGMIQWTDSQDTPCYVKILPGTYVQVLGEAEPNFLRPGLLVQFTGTIQGRGTVAEPIEEITIFTPRDGYSIGVVDEDGDSKRDDGPKKIAGQLKSIKNGKITVVAGKQTIKAELVEEPTVQIDISDYSLAAPGDEITISGLGLDRTKIEATGIEIQLTEKLRGMDQRKKPGRAKKGDDAPDQAEGTR